MSRQKIAEYDARYMRLRGGWGEARNQIVGAITSLGFNSDRIVDTTDDDEVRILVCGAHVYIRFKHDLEHGFIEYGVLKVSPDGKCQTRVEVETLQFDHLGNVSQHWNLKPGVGLEFRELHLKTLAEKTPEILRCYFDLPEELLI